jgi:hypothetical protein
MYRQIHTHLCIRHGVQTSTYEGKKVNTIAMCEVMSTKKTTKNKPKKKNTMVNSEKKWTLMNPI